MFERKSVSPGFRGYFANMYRRYPAEAHVLSIMYIVTTMRDLITSFV